VKEIEARLGKAHRQSHFVPTCLPCPSAQVESYLKEVNKGVEEGANSNASQQSDPSLGQGDFTLESPPVGSDGAESQQPAQPHGGAFAFTDFSGPQEDTFMGNGALMGLGYSETLPPLEVQEEL
jgi:hypothetical protein